MKTSVLMLVSMKTFVLILVFVMKIMAGVKTYDEYVNNNNNMGVFVDIDDFVPAAAGADLYQTKL